MHLLLNALLRIFAVLVSRGGEPLQETREGQFGLTYPIRPGTRIFTLASLAVGLYLLVHSGRDLTHVPLSVHPLNLSNPLMQLLLACFLILFPAVLLSRTVRLDEQGLSVSTLLRPTARIPWSQFSHVERYRSTSAGKATFYIRSRSRPGSEHRQTTITLPEMTYNVPHLLTEIRRRVPLPELPRKKQHWWGG